MRLMRAIILLSVLALLAAACSSEGGLATGGPAPSPTQSAADEPLQRITITEPREGATVSDALTVSGNASVYEATVALRVLDPEGAVALATFTTATAAAPDRGTWSMRIQMPNGPAGTWTIEAAEESAEDGSDAFVASRQVEYGGSGTGEETAVAPITITEPREGATVAGAVTVRGEASVYEANVTLRLRDPNGAVRLETFATATDAAPNRGTWSTEIAIPDAPTGTWTIEAVEVSAEDGSDAFVTTRHVQVAEDGSA